MVISACTVIGHEQVQGWPQLQVFEHHVPTAEMRERCAKYTGFGVSPEACAEFRLAENRCDIWYSADFPPTAAIIEHERLHCAGYDHVGQKHMQAILERHLRAGPVAARSTP